MAMISDRRPSAAPTYHSSPPMAHHFSPGPPIYPHSHHGTPAHEYNGFNFQRSPQLAMPPSAFIVPYPQCPMPHGPPLGMPPVGEASQLPLWPSMLSSNQLTTHHEPYAAAYDAPPVPPLPALPPKAPHEPVQIPQAEPLSRSGSLPMPISASSLRPQPIQRKLLSDEDRRKMCIYAEKNPNRKQTEIGAMFGVERSTVSKVLRQKEKYMQPDNGKRSPVKRSKSKTPDIYKALAKWCKNQIRLKKPLSDEDILDRARHFFTMTSVDTKTLTPAWIEKFKLTYNVLGARSRKASVVTDDDEPMPTVAGQSPASTPLTLRSPLPTKLSHHASLDSLQYGSPDSFVEFRQPFQSASNASLNAAFVDACPMSPSSSFFTSDSSTAPPGYLAMPLSRSPESTLMPVHVARPRSQTFPLMDNFTVPSDNTMIPRYVNPSLLDSPMEELGDPMGQIDAAIIHPAPSHPTPPLSQEQQATVAPAIVSMPPPPHHVLLTTAPPRDLGIDFFPTAADEQSRAFDVVRHINDAQQKLQPATCLDPHESALFCQLLEKIRLAHRSAIMA